MSKHYPALEILITNLFDYAGIYPPEQKSLSEAVSCSLAFHQSLKRPHLLASNIVVGTGQITELEGLLQAQAQSESIDYKICTLGQSIQNQALSISAEHSEELNLIQEYNLTKMRLRSQRRIVSYEIKLDRKLNQDFTFLRIALRNLKAFFQEEKVQLCVECDLSSSTWEHEARGLIELFSEIDQSCRGAPLVFKLRGAGPSAVTNEKLSLVLFQSALSNLSLKLTAGLHHPLIEKERYGNSLGFINVLVALILSRAMVNKLSVAHIRECLEDVNLKNFAFGNHVSWRNYKISIEELQALRNNFKFSIGSCSLHEPDDDLNRLFPSS